MRGMPIRPDYSAVAARLRALSGHTVHLVFPYPSPPGDKIGRASLAWSKRAGLRAGYGAVIAVLVFSAYEAYRIQDSVSRQHLEIYRHFVEQDEALATLRKNLWLAGNYVRDFFINSTPAQISLYRRQLDDLKRENDQALQVLERAPHHRRVAPQLRSSLGEFWKVVDPLPVTMLHASDQQQMDFLNRE